MNKELIYKFIKAHKLAIISTVADKEKPQAALVGFAVSENLELIFDTVKTSRKYQNIIQNPSVAVVIGWDNETTVQYEGIASELVGSHNEHLKEIYFNVYPDGRERTTTWPGLVHIKISPTWIRYSNFNDPAVVEEMIFP